MANEASEWLVGRWQWPAAALFTAIVLTLLLPVWYADAGIVTIAVVLQLPLYMFHQYEEHHGNRFVLYFNRVMGGGWCVGRHLRFNSALPVFLARLRHDSNGFVFGQRPYSCTTCRTSTRI